MKLYVIIILEYKLQRGYTMIFGILALTLKNKILGIIAIISGISLSIIWLLAGIVGEAMFGGLILIVITCLPDLTMGIISLAKYKNKENMQTLNQEAPKRDSLPLTEKLLELNSLKEKGLLTEEEYLAAKSILLKN
jgi:hypothetical protein